MFGPCFVMQHSVSFISLGKRELNCLLAATCLFLRVPSVGLKCVIVAFPGHIHFLFVYEKYTLPLISRNTIQHQPVKFTHYQTPF